MSKSNFEFIILWHKEWLNRNTTKIKINCNGNPHNNHNVEHKQYCQIETWSTMTHLCFDLFLVCLYVCVCECLLRNNMRTYTSNQYSYVWSPLREYLLIQSGASGLPCYCAPLVCVSKVIELLTVWWHNKPKTQNQKPKTTLVKTHLFGLLETVV